MTRSPNRIAKVCDLSWLDFFEAQCEPDSLSGMIKWLLTHRDSLTAWEVRFLESLGPSLSPRQRDALDKITRKVRGKTGARI